MTRQETGRIMAILQVAYPTFYRGVSPVDAEAAVTLWADIFAGDSYDLVELAVKALIATKVEGYPPTIGAVKQQMAKLQTPEGLTEHDAWRLVSKAIGNGIYGAEKEFGKLPESVQRVVGSPSALREWATMDADVVQSVVASNFQRAFRERSKRDRDFLVYPEEVRRIASTLVEPKGLLPGDERR